MKSFFTLLLAATASAHYSAEKPHYNGTAVATSTSTRPASYVVATGSGGYFPTGSSSKVAYATGTGGYYATSHTTLVTATGAAGTGAAGTGSGSGSGSKNGTFSATATPSPASSSAAGAGGSGSTGTTSSTTSGPTAGAVTQSAPGLLALLGIAAFYVL
jgi:hypothetical protein